MNPVREEIERMDGHRVVNSISTCRYIHRKYGHGYPGWFRVESSRDYLEMLMTRAMMILCRVTL